MTAIPTQSRDGGAALGVLLLLLSVSACGSAGASPSQTRALTKPAVVAVPADATNEGTPQTGDTPIKAASKGTEAAVPRSNALRERTPYLPAPVESRRLVKDESHAGVLCKKGAELGVDPKGRIAFCTTAHRVKVGGLKLAADAYTLFYPSGALYQTLLGSAHRLTLADGATVTCDRGSISLGASGELLSCQLGARASFRPRARVGAGIAFFDSGKPSGYTLGRDTTIAGLAIPAGSSLRWDETGRLLGGHLKGPTALGSLMIRSTFEMHGHGKVAALVLAEPATVQQHAFPAFAVLEFRADGTLERSEYVAKRGFMIHGEPWTDTRHTRYARDGLVIADRVEHYQSELRPPKFRGKR